jgi:hypothetical protein
MTLEIFFIHILPPFVGGIFSLAAAIFAWKAATAVKEVHLLFNSRMTELMAVQKTLSFIQGGDEARAAQDTKESKP